MTDEPCTLVILAADTLLEFDGIPQGKPGTAEVARERLRAMSGGHGTLYTGHYVAVIRGREHDIKVAVTATEVYFAQLSEAEIEAYIATGEPLYVAGSFTIDGFGGPFIDRIAGDPHNVIGISLPLVRSLLAEAGVPWFDLVG
jgi:septum formation protein